MKLLLKAIIDLVGNIRKLQVKKQHQQSCKLCEAKTIKNERGNRSIQLQLETTHPSLNKR